ncbi:MAG: histidine phosphatase family protein [Candidatus Micrarchaeia archaeon]
MNHTLVLRHADREELKTKEKAPFAKLTFKGKLKALQQGVLLRITYGDIHRIHSSRTSRCIQTASIISIPFMAGKFNGNRPKLQVDLDYYGFFSTGYVRDGHFDAWMEDVFNSARWSNYTEMFAKWAEKGLLKCTLREFGKQFISNYLVDHNILAITHDSIIGPLMESLSYEYGFKLREHMIWPNPLAGFCIEHENGRIYTIKWYEYMKEPQILF